MASYQELLNSHPEFIQAYNAISPLLQNAVALILQERLGTEVDPNSLPRVEIVDNERTKAVVEQMQPWTVPMIAATVNTLFGENIERIELHPDVLIQRAVDLAQQLGESQISEYMGKHGLTDIGMMYHLLDESAAQVMTHAFLVQNPEISDVEIYSDAINRALDQRDAGI